MNILTLFPSNKLLLGIILLIFLINLGCIIYLILKERKKDEEEIDDILISLAKAKPRNTKTIEENEKKEEVEVVEAVNKPKLEIDKVLEKMQKDLEATTSNEVENFERDQEEKSIISYQELVNSMKKQEPIVEEVKNMLGESLNEDDFTGESKVEAEEPVIDVIDIDETVQMPKISKKEKSNEKEDKKFKKTDFISPIYGKLDEIEMDYPTVPQFSKLDELEELLEEQVPKRSRKSLDEETLDVSPLHNEIEKNDEFLRTLKDFRGNL
jgi:hypothetical protein